MSLIRYNNPWNLLDTLQRELYNPMQHRLSDDEDSVATANWAPSVDISENDNAFTLLADIPGVDPKDIDVHMENGILTIRGEKESEKKEEREGYKRVERSFGSFYRRFSLPDTANPEDITANSNHGVLEVRIGKQQKVQPRKIEVRVG